MSSHAATRTDSRAIRSASLSWRWVLFVNLPVCVAVLAGASRLVAESKPLPFGGKGFGLSNFDLPGAFLGTGGMLLLVFGLVRAPVDGWGATRPLIVGGAVIAAGGVFWLSRIPADGHYWTDLFPGLVVMAFGLGGVFVGVQTAAQAGVPPRLAGLASALINASFQVGAALGLAIFAAVATSWTSTLEAEHVTRAAALTDGFHRALLLSSIFILAAAVIALRAANTRGEPASEIAGMAVADSAVGNARNGRMGSWG